MFSVRSSVCFLALLPLTALWAMSTPLPEPQSTPVPRTVAENLFTVTRPLGYYVNRLEVEFLRDLANLGPNSHWIDGGSGEGIAIEQYHQLGSNPRALIYSDGLARELLQRIAMTPPEARAFVSGITYHMVREGSRHYQHRLRHLSGRLIEDIPDSEIGRADLITDVYGVFPYTSRLDEGMKKYLTALKPNGKLYLFAAHMDRTSVSLEGEGARPMPILRWLESISGIRVENLDSVLRITKTGGPNRIPRLRFISEDDQSPPARVFVQTGEEPLVVPRDTGTPQGPGTDFTRRLRFNPSTPARPLSPLAVEQMNQALGYSDSIAGNR